MSRNTKTTDASLIIVVICLTAILTLAQKNDDKKLRIVQNRSLIPEASLPCTPDETAWWNDLRVAGEAVRKTRGATNERTRFLELLTQGEEKDYQPPIPDSKQVILFKSEPDYTEEARQRRIKGTVSIEVELLPNGRVGEVTLLNRLGSGLDENVEAAVRRTLFLPPVRERKFISTTIKMSMSFDLY